MKTGREEGRSPEASVAPADWSREQPQRFWDPGRQLLRALRGYQAAVDGNRTIAAKWWVLQHRFWSSVTGAEIPLNCEIGGGLSIPHPNGIVIHPWAKIGVNCLIMHQVTLGTNGNDGAPVIGDGVDIGPGAKILGPVHVGSGAMVGALTLVMKDVAADDVVFGIPARSSGRSARDVRARLAAR